MSSNRADIAAAFQHLTSLFDVSNLTSAADVIKAARAGVERYGDVTPRPPLSGVILEPVTIGDMAAEWIFTTSARTETRLLYIHGGGILAGSLSSHRPLAASLAVATNYPVLNIDYRLAPEHTFPAAHDDCAMAYDWMQDFAPQGRRESANAVFVVGDSVGGNLAAALCADTISRKRRIPDRLALLSPCLDNTDNPVRPERSSDPLINAQVVAGILAYATDTPRDDPRISAVVTPDTVLMHFPPTLIQVSGAEYLLPDSLTFAARLTALNRRNDLSVWPDMPHSWHCFQDFLPEAKDAVAQVAAFLR